MVHFSAIIRVTFIISNIPIIDGSGFPRKGTESAGVARQYCNQTGKTDNCQVGVYLAYSSPKGYKLLDRRLHLPGKWFSDEYATRRQRCGIPEEITFCSHQELAWEMLKGVSQRQVVTFQQEFREDMPALTVPQARMLLESVLPKQVFDADAALEALSKIQACPFA